MLNKRTKAKLKSSYLLHRPSVDESSWILAILRTKIQLLRDYNQYNETGGETGREIYMHVENVANCFQYSIPWAPAGKTRQSEINRGGGRVCILRGFLTEPDESLEFGTSKGVKMNNS